MGKAGESSGFNWSHMELIWSNKLVFQYLFLRLNDLSCKAWIQTKGAKKKIKKKADSLQDRVPDCQSHVFFCFS